MKIIFMLKNNSGFTLVQAVFILVVLGLLGAAMVRLSGVQSSTSVFALQGARAYQAARSGLEWGAARAAAGDDCSGSLNIDSFSVSVSCLAEPVTEGSDAYSVYTLTSEANFGSYGSVDYVSRKVQMKAKWP